jgi:hypothetical protein
MKKILLLFLVLWALNACDKEPADPDILNFSKTRGVFISCEGNFLYGNASLSFYDIKNKKVYNDVYYARNQAPLGDVAQSMELNGDHVFIVVNNSGKVVVVDKNTLEFKGVVKGLLSPRAVHFVNNNKAYISDMMARKITVIHPETLVTAGYIGVSDGKSGSTGHSTENFLQAGNFVFVTCWVSDNKILVIDTRTDQVVDSIIVPFQPNKLLMDINNKIWVQCDGEYFNVNGNPEKPALVRMDAVSRKVEKIFRLNREGAFFTDIRLNPKKDSILFMAGDMFKMSVYSEQLPDKELIATGSHGYYSFGVDPLTGEIYLGDALDYSRNGNIYRFSPGGVPVDTFMVGVCPGDFVFKN